MLNLLLPFFKLLPVCLSLFGAFLAIFLYSSSSKFLYLVKVSETGRNLFTFLNRKWFFDKFYNETINQAFLDFGYHISYKTLDRGFIEMIGPFGISRAIYLKSTILSNLQTGNFYDYALWMFFGFCIFLFLATSVILADTFSLFMFVSTLFFVNKVSK